MKKIVIQKVGTMLHKEMKVMCKSDSGFCNKDTSALENFQWANIATELKGKAPFLYALLDRAIEKSGLQKDIAMVISSTIILKSNSELANIVQRLISLLLYTSHDLKQVCAYVVVNHFYDTFYYSPMYVCLKLGFVLLAKPQYV